MPLGYNRRKTWFTRKGKVISPEGGKMLAIWQSGGRRKR
jgi:hypothetical protein